MTQIIDFKKKKEALKRKLTQEEFDTYMASAILDINAEWNYHCNNGTVNKLCQEYLSHSKWLINYADMNLILKLETQLNVEFQITKKSPLETIVLTGYIDNYEYTVSASTEM